MIRKVNKDLIRNHLFPSCCLRVRLPFSVQIPFDFRMKTEPLANGSPSLPVPLGFPMLDYLPASFLVTNYFSKSFFHASIFLFYGPPPTPVTSHISLCHAQGFSKHTCVLGAAGQAHVFCTLSLRRGGQAPCPASQPQNQSQVSESGNRPVNRPFNLSMIHNFYDNIGFRDSVPPNPKIQGPPPKHQELPTQRMKRELVGLHC